MTAKKLTPERIADGKRLMTSTFSRTVDFTERVLKFAWELLGHIEALEAELAVEKQRVLDLLAAGIREGAELAKSRAECERLREILDDAGYSFELSMWLP